MKDKISLKLKKLFQKKKKDLENKKEESSDSLSWMGQRNLEPEVPGQYPWLKVDYSAGDPSGLGLWMENRFSKTEAYDLYPWLKGDYSAVEPSGSVLWKEDSFSETEASGQKAWLVSDISTVEPYGSVLWKEDGFSETEASGQKAWLVSDISEDKSHRHSRIVKRFPSKKKVNVEESPIDKLIDLLHKEKENVYKLEIELIKSNQESILIERKYSSRLEKLISDYNYRISESDSIVDSLKEEIKELRLNIEDLQLFVKTPSLTNEKMRSILEKYKIEGERELL